MKKILMFGVLFLLFSFKHPFYLSVTDLKYNMKEKALQGSVKIFTNDLEDALKKIHGRTIDLVNPKDTLKTLALLTDYLKKHLSFELNNEKREYSVLGFEKEQEALWMYIEMPRCNFPKKIGIKNRILYDYLSEQMNIMHVEVKEEKKSLKLNNPEEQAVFEF